MRIVCLAADASRNPLVRLVPIAKVLQRNHDVTVAGFRSTDEVFAPYADEFEYRTVRARSMPSFIRQVREIAASVSADVVYSFKPLSTSLWPGLAARRRLGIPLVVDIEDWELGWYRDRDPSDQLRHLGHLERANGMFWTALNERTLVRSADHITVASSSLQKRFGGNLLPHGPDTDEFDPRLWPRDVALRELGLEDAEYVVFAGTPMPHKGLEDALDVLERISRPDVRMLIVGSFAHDTGYEALLRRRYGNLLTVVEPRPHREMPLFLSVAQVVVLAQRRTRVTDAQMPAKVYEAMAMARPVIASAVSDLDTVLDRCGVIVPPGDRDALWEALERILSDESEQLALGAAARKRCIERYGWDAMERILERDLASLAN